MRNCGSTLAESTPCPDLFCGEKPHPALLWEDGGADRDRTCDLLIANETLYQLSYDPIQRWTLTTNRQHGRIMRPTGQAASFFQTAVGSRQAMNPNAAERSSGKGSRSLVELDRAPDAIGTCPASRNTVCDEARAGRRAGLRSGRVPPSRTSIHSSRPARASSHPATAQCEAERHCHHQPRERPRAVPAREPVREVNDDAGKNPASATPSRKRAT